MNIQQRKISQVLILGVMIGFAALPAFVEARREDIRMDMDGAGGGGDDGGGGGGGTSVHCLNASDCADPKCGSFAICKSENWPSPGTGVDLQWCSNGAKTQVTGRCEGTQYCLTVTVGGFSTCFEDHNRCPPPKPVCSVMVGQACVSGVNKCGMTNSGSLQGCSESSLSCNARTPSDQECPKPPDVTVSCTSPANACGMTNSGVSVNGGVCSARTPSDSLCPVLCASNVGRECSSIANMCGMRAQGAFSCTGSCDAVTPSNTLCSKPPDDVYTPCASSANSCGMTNAGVSKNGGSCSAARPSDALCPPDVEDMVSCVSHANLCGMTNTGVSIGGRTCTAVVPPNSLCPKKDVITPCNSAANSCGMINSGVSINGGACSVGAPSNALCPVAPVCAASSGRTCRSSANSCGMTNSGSFNCDGDCGAITPSETRCAPPVPTVSIGASPSEVQRGSTVSVAWSSSNTDSCSITPTGWTGTSGRNVSVALTSNTTFTIVCTGAGGQTTQATTVVPVSSPQLQITERPLSNIRTVYGDTHAQRLVVKNVGTGVLHGRINLKDNREQMFYVVRNSFVDSSRSHKRKGQNPLDYLESDLSFNLSSGETKTFTVVFYANKKPEHDQPGSKKSKGRKSSAALLGATAASGGKLAQASEDVEPEEVFGSSLVEVTSDGGNENVPLSGTSVSPVNGGAAFSIGDVAGGTLRASGYQIRNFSGADIQACITVTNNASFTCNGGSSCNVAIANGGRAFPQFAFKAPVLAAYPQSYTALVNVGSVQTDGSCLNEYNFEISAQSVKPKIEFQER